MQCSACGADNLPANRFCGGCGAALAATCSACGHQNPAGQRFCGQCGMLLDAFGAGSAATAARAAGTAVGSGPPRPAGDGERRSVTVLFADLVGFTGLAEQLD